MCDESRVISNFADYLTVDDVALHKITVGDHRAQQCAEALATMVALRVWSPLWKESRVSLTLKGDSITALTSALDVRVAGPTVGLIAREVALNVA